MYGVGVGGSTDTHVSAEKRLLLAQELQGLAPAQRAQMLRAMPLSLAEKRRLWSVPAGSGHCGVEPSWGLGFQGCVS